MSLEKPVINFGTWYPYETATEVIGGVPVLWPNLRMDPIDKNWKFWNGRSFLNGLKIDESGSQDVGQQASSGRASFIPAETMNLIIDNIESLLNKISFEITAPHTTSGRLWFPISDNAYKEQLSWFFTYNIQEYEISDSLNIRRPRAASVTYEDGDSNFRLRPVNPDLLSDGRPAPNLPLFHTESFKTAVLRSWDGSARVTPTTNNYYEYAAIPRYFDGRILPYPNLRWLTGPWNPNQPSNVEPTESDDNVVYVQQQGTKITGVPIIYTTEPGDKQLYNENEDPRRYSVYPNSQNIVTKHNLDIESYYRKAEDDRIERRMLRALYGLELQHDWIEDETKNLIRNQKDYLDYTNGGFHIGWPIKNRENVTVKDRFKPIEHFSMINYLREWLNRLEDNKVDRFAPYLAESNDNEGNLTVPKTAQPEPSWNFRTIHSSIADLYNEARVPLEADILQPENSKIKGIRYCWAVNNTTDQGVYILQSGTPPDGRQVRNINNIVIPNVRYVKQDDLRPSSYVEIVSIYNTYKNLAELLNSTIAKPAIDTEFSVVNYDVATGGVYKVTTAVAPNAQMLINHFSWTPFKNIYHPSLNTPLTLSDVQLNNSWGDGYYLITRPDASVPPGSIGFRDVAQRIGEEVTILNHMKFFTQDEMVNRFNGLLLETGKLYYVVNDSAADGTIPAGTKGTYLVVGGASQRLEKLSGFTDAVFESVWRTAHLDQIATVKYVHQQVSNFNVNNVNAVNPTNVTFNQLIEPGLYYVVTGSDNRAGDPTPNVADSWFVDVKAFDGWVIQKAESLTNPANIFRRVRGKDVTSWTGINWTYAYAKWFQ